MAVNETVRTTLGQEASAYLLAHGGTLNFTRVALGSGECNIPFEDMTALTDAKKNLSIQAVEYKGGTQIKVRAELDNSDLTSALVYREIGLFATDPETNEEILFEYGNAKTAQSDYTETIPAYSGSGSHVMRFFELDAYVSNAENATFTIDNTGKADIITVQNIRDDLTAEITARTNADTAEATARTTGDTNTLASAKSYTNSKVSTEATARQTADTTLQGNITAEATARTSGDSSTLASAKSYTDSVASGKANSSHTHTKAECGLGNVDNTSDANKPISTATQNALNGKSATSHTHTKAQCGLGNVDNTSDANKPISTATQTALNGKSATSHTHTGAQLSTQINLLTTETAAPTDADYYICQSAGGGTTTTSYHRRTMSALWAWIKGKTDAVYSALSHTHTKAQCGLSNVDNTSDANKPISTATQTALNGKSATSHTHSNATTSTSGFMSATDKTTMSHFKIFSFNGKNGIYIYNTLMGAIGSVLSTEDAIKGFGMGGFTMGSYSSFFNYIMIDEQSILLIDGQNDVASTLTATDGTVYNYFRMVFFY